MSAVVTNGVLHTTSMGHRILIADDDRELSELLVRYLGRQGFEVETAASAEHALARLEQPPKPDLLILDVMLPGKDGLAALRELRASHGLPVLMLSARGEPRDRVVGLELGADDYMAKPALPRELLARVQALLRRGPARMAGRLEVGALEFDLDAHSARLEGRPLKLTGAEFGLLLCLARSAGAPVEKSALSLAGLGRPGGGADRSVDVHVSRLRQKLAELSQHAPVIESVRGIGYVMLTAPA